MEMKHSTSPQPIHLYSSQCLLGESPLWHASRKSFFWVDIENGKLFEYHLKTGATTIKSFPHRLTLVLEGKENQVILALDCKIASYDLETGALNWLCEVETEFPLNRFNDGKCDSKGRLWIGTLSTEFTAGSGSLYRIGKDLEPHRVLDMLTIPNGMAWTADHSVFYFIDSLTQKIREYQFNLESGEIESSKTAVEIPDQLGLPDGMCIDTEGMLWIAHYGGSGVYRWNPQTGELIEKIELPVPHVTSCAFGGENMDLLLITSARENLDEAQLKEFPLSGDVFVVNTKVSGSRAFNFLL